MSVALPMVADLMKSGCSATGACHKRASMKKAVAMKAGTALKERMDDKREDMVC